MKVLILAGGNGTRLWPYSRLCFPKQFLHFGDGESLLEKTIKRFIKGGFQKDIWICTNALYKPLIEQLIKNQNHQILIEPQSRNTAPAIVFSIKEMMEKGALQSEDSLVVAPSDHLLQDDEKFLQILRKLEPFAQSGHLVTFGVKPHSPETGYGYLEIEEEIEKEIYKVKRFVEKPKKEKAIEFYQSEKFLWNSGIFLFKISTFLEEIKKHAPELFHEDPPALSIDHALMEKSNKVLTAKLPLKWSDVGSWDSVYDISSKDENGNVLVGNVHTKETKNSLIMGEKRLITTIGIEEMLILETEDALFIAPRGESQKVKEMVEKLKKEKRKEVEK